MEKEDTMRSFAEDLVVERLSNVEKRIIIIGDIHGCYDELLTLLHKINYNESTDLLISVGDLIMKGPKSSQVLSFFRNNKNAICIKGNHEYAVQRWYEYVDQKTQNAESFHPIPYGLKENSEHHKFAQTMTPQEYTYIKKMPHMLLIDDMVVVIHAGINPAFPLLQQNTFDLMHVRNIADGKCTEKISIGCQWTETIADHDNIYIFGHDALRGLQIGRNFYGLDSACLYGKKLSCVIYPSMEIIDVDAQQRYVEGDASSLI